MNYYDAWVNGNYTQIFMNSLTLVIGTLILNLTVSGLAAFSLAVLNPRGIQTIVVGLYLLVGISIPAQLFILPLFLMWKSLYLLDTRIGLVIRYVDSDTYHLKDKNDSALNIIGQKSKYFENEKIPIGEFTENNILEYESKSKTAGTFGNKQY